MIPTVFNPDHLNDLRHAAAEILKQDALYEAIDFGDGLIVYQYHDSLLTFHGLSREFDFYPEFDWLAETPFADRLIRHPEDVAQLDLDNLRKVLCIHYKNEAFYPGHLALLIDEGHYHLLLRRLIELN